MKSKFTDRESRGVVALLIIILVITLVCWGSRLLEERQRSESLVRLSAAVESDSIQLFTFDPNTVTLKELRQLGLSKSEAVSIIRYREYGKVFRIKEDLYTCYGVSDSLYYALEPYIEIADTFRLKIRAEYSAHAYKTHQSQRECEPVQPLPLSEFLIDTVGANYLVAVGVLSRRQAEVFVRWRDLSGISNMDQLRDCYVVSDSVASLLEPYVRFTPPAIEAAGTLVDINNADSAQLCAVYGVGAKSAEAIINYRKLLGGFHSAEQLSELKVITESNFEKIIQQISCDSCDISKIDVNFASAKQMSGHPYIAPKVLRRLLKIRELKGGWSTVEEMIDDNIFTKEEATRVRPYLLFEERGPR